MKNIILIAPPAAGKGTQSKMLQLEYNIPHISTGQLFRDEISSQTAIGKRIENDMKNGRLIEDDLVLSILMKRLKNKDCNNGYILDGFPRTIKQAIEYDKLLTKENKEINYVFYLELERDMALKRTIGRLICSNCSQIYNDLFEETSPQIANVCDDCKGTLIKRVDDNLEVFNNRYETYLTQTYPIIDHYSKLNKLYYIDSSINKEYTFKQIKNVLDGIN